MEIKTRIVEVLTKYNRPLDDAPLEALTMAMKRLIESRLTVSPDTTEINSIPSQALARVRELEAERDKLNVIIANHGVTQLEKTRVMLSQKVRIVQLEAERCGACRAKDRTLYQQKPQAETE